MEKYDGGAWHIESMLGEGSYGKVYKIAKRENDLKYYAALKVIAVPQTSSEASRLMAEGLRDDSLRAYIDEMVEDIMRGIRFALEFRDSPNIVGCEDNEVLEKEGEPGYNILMRMELLESLEELLFAGELGENDAVSAGLGICKALEILARNGTMHLGIKPDNIFRSKNGDFKLGDFGVAKQIEGSTSGLSNRVTRYYMAPEAFKGLECYESTDLYSLGLVMHRIMNNGRMPFIPPYETKLSPSDREAALARRMSGEDLPPPEFASSALSHIILKACAFDPEKRFKTASEMRRALEDYKLPAIVLPPLAGAEGALAEGSGPGLETELVSLGGDSSEGAPDGSKECSGEDPKAKDAHGKAGVAGSRKPKGKGKNKSKDNKSKDTEKDADEEIEKPKVSGMTEFNIIRSLALVALVLIFVFGFLWINNTISTVLIVDFEAPTDAPEVTPEVTEDPVPVEITEEEILEEILEIDKIWILGVPYNAKYASLYLDNMMLEDEDLIELRHMTNLRVLDLKSNNINDVSILTSIKNLDTLYLDSNPLTDISSLGDVERLGTLSLNGNPQMDFSGISKLKRLKVLYLKENNIKDISVFSKLASLESLDLSGNAINEVGELANLAKLKYLDLSGNPIPKTQVESLKKALPDCRIYF
ncbi:MAG: leucine-rich repeat domain-containing protein [Clostridiales bacterium]|jgi:serine/threonine protein kinase|nr:leucine-rich repeat domain-containing protein [Clostridiales bacterium]